MTISDPVALLILFGVGIIAGFINVTAGGGSTLTLPVLIFLGLESSLANGTNRVAILLQNISAVYSFKQEKYQQFNTSIKFALLTLPGAVLGALLAVRLDDVVFQKILGIIMIAIIFSMLFTQKDSVTENKNIKMSLPVYLSMFGIGFYGGFIQVGVGFLLMASLRYLMKLNLVLVNMHKVFIVLIYTVPALVIFVFTDNINWIFGLCLAAGNVIGGWWGAKVSVKKGEGFIKTVLVIAVFIMALKLIGIF
ncbi:MAG: sulfite exporter TauE/SafE family protein [Ignavibacteria bacterium]|nr:sulfite exporter TauE/SafE family protein [Ignavibacteria bacterium]